MSRSDFDFESRLVPLLLGYAKQKGVAVEPLIAKYKLPLDVLSQQPGKLQLTTPMSVVPAITDEVAAALNDPHLGISLSDWLPRGAYGVAEFLMRAGPTLRHSFQNFCRFNAIIAKDGTIQNLQVVSGHPLLIPSATEAVRQWIYKPTQLNGEPVEVQTQIDVNFTLSN